jgi:hypothetical protein
MTKLRDDISKKFAILRGKDRMSPYLLDWFVWEVSLGDYVKKCYLFASLQDVDYGSSGGVLHQSQEIFCPCDGQAV